MTDTNIETITVAFSLLKNSLKDISDEFATYSLADLDPRAFQSGTLCRIENASHGLKA